MATNGDHETPLQAVIGNAKNFWLYDSKTGFDLTHPETTTAPVVIPRVTIETKTSPIAIDPAKSALVVIVSKLMGKMLLEVRDSSHVVAFRDNFKIIRGRKRGAGHDALDQLVNTAIPACRKAGIRVIWLNWGLSQQDIDEMPPAIHRAFGFEAKVQDESVAVDKHGNANFKGGDKQFEDGKKGAKYSGPGSSMGKVVDPESGKEFDAGRLLMRDQWNSALYPPLDKLYDEGKNLETRPDVWIHKNRMSGMWGPMTACEEFLEKEGIKTLLFTGVNTDQCVGGTYQDCFSKGYDCILLNDGCGTTSPKFAQQTVEYNASNTWGFNTSCKALADGVESMQE